MKKIKFITLLITAFLVSNCSNDVLDIAPDGNLQLEEVLADPEKVEGMVNKLYDQIPGKGYRYWYHEPMVVAASDDAWTSEDNAGQAIDQYYKGSSSAGFHLLTDFPDINGSSTSHYWDRYWSQIRLCSQMIEVIDEAAVNTEADRGRFRAEAKVLRSFFYMELIRWFGRVPVLDETVPFDADFSDYARQSVYEVAALIIKDCNDAIAEPALPWRITTASSGGRVTKALAAALRSEAIMFAASPLHNEGQNHWEEAYQLSKTSVDELKANGYELFTATTQPSVFGTGPAAAYRELAVTNVEYNATPKDKETIFTSTFPQWHTWHIGYIGSGVPGTAFCGTTPSQELVDAFETTDGQPILDLTNPYLDDKHLEPNYNSANTLYDPNDPYANRDPRLDQVVIHNESKFIYNNVEVNAEVFIGGAHQPSLNGGNRLASRTGYYHAKMIFPGASGNMGVLGPNWKFYRLAETLLNLAETAAEAGHEAEALTAVNEVRARCNMPPILSGDPNLILRIRNERRIELAWEENRFYDLRRWQTPSGDLGDTSKWFTGMYITKNGDGSFSYERRSITSIPRGGWDNKSLLLPIPLNEASLLESVTGEVWQNPGW